MFILSCVSFEAPRAPEPKRLGGPTRIRTLVDGFGDHNSTTEL